MPRQLRRALTGHVVSTVQRMGWSGKRNGDLLRLMAAAGIDVLLTVDRGIPHQQNVQVAGVAVVVMAGVGNRYPDLFPLVPKVLAALASIQPGDVIEIGP